MKYNSVRDLDLLAVYLFLVEVAVWPYLIKQLLLIEELSHRDLMMDYFAPFIAAAILLSLWSMTVTAVEIATNQ